MKVALLQAIFADTQFRLGEIGLRTDLSAFWGQFIIYYDNITRSLRRNRNEQVGDINLNDDLDLESEALVVQLQDWLKHI